MYKPEQSFRSKPEQSLKSLSRQSLAEKIKDSGGANSTTLYEKKTTSRSLL